jgi:predicted exporter
MKMMREKMSEWVLHCAVDQRHIRRSQPTREAALQDACSQLLQGRAVNRIVGPSETINAHKIKDWCAKHRPSLAQSREAANL